MQAPSLRIVLSIALGLWGCESCGRPSATPERLDGFSIEIPAPRDRVTGSFWLVDRIGENTVVAGTLRIEVRERAPTMPEAEGIVLCSATLPITLEMYETTSWSAVFAAPLSPPCPAAEPSRYDVVREAVLTFDGGGQTFQHVDDVAYDVRTGLDREAASQAARRARETSDPEAVARLDRLREAAASIGAIVAAPRPDPMPRSCGAIEGATAPLISWPTALQLAGREAPDDRCPVVSSTEIWAQVLSAIRAVNSFGADELRAAVDALGPYVWILETTSCTPASMGEPGTQTFFAGSFHGWLVLADRSTGAVLCGAPVDAESSGDVVRSGPHVDTRMAGAIEADLQTNIARAAETARTSLTGASLAFIAPPAP